MSRLLLDTTFLIGAERSSGDLDTVIDDDDDVAISAITVAELRAGILLAKPNHQRQRSDFLHQLVNSLPVVDYGLEVAEAHAKLLVAVRSEGRRRGAHDLIVAASALATERSVVTADGAAFADLPGVHVRCHAR